MSLNDYRRREWAKKGFDFVCFAHQDDIVCGDLGLGAELRERRLEAGFRLEDLAAKIGYSPMTLSYWENNLIVT